jgi:hypothetical protein
MRHLVKTRVFRVPRRAGVHERGGSFRSCCSRMSSWVRKASSMGSESVKKFSDLELELDDEFARVRVVGGTVLDDGGLGYAGGVG